MKNYELQAFLQFDDGSSGNAAANQSFNVTIARGANVGDDATIYQDAAGTIELTRPFQTDQYGRFKFYAANGYYNILFDDPDVANLNNLLDRDIFTVEQASQTVVGLTRYSTQAEALSGTDNSSAMTPLRVEQSIQDYGIGSSTRADFNKKNIESKPTGIYTGFGGQHPNATTGDNPFPSFGGAFSCFSSTGFSAGLSDYRADIACQLTNLANYRLRFRSSTTVINEWVDIHTDVTLLYATNTSGALISNGEIVSGSSITPVRVGSYRNCSGNDIANGAGGLFIKEW